METIKKLRFEISGYYFIGLFGLVILGFWPSYFAKFFDGTAKLYILFSFPCGHDDALDLHAHHSTGADQEKETEVSQVNR